jgi:hypothetical protein
VVELVEVDVVGLQALQTGIEGPADIECREPGLVGPVRHDAVELGREHGAFAALAAFGEPPANDFLGPAAVLSPAINIGRVEEVDPGLQCGIHDGMGRGFVSSGAEIHGAEAQPGDFQAGAAQMGVLHGVPSLG